MKKWLKRLGIAFGVMVLLVTVTAWRLWSYYTPQTERTDGVVYGQRNGVDLTMDVIRPANPNGLGIAFMVSGGWKSQKAGEPPAWLMSPLLNRGYTIFAVCHISQPESTVPEIIDDMHRAIRYIRLHAKEYSIDPKRLGVTGGSAGGHLSLMLATRGGEGKNDEEDPVERESSAVQAVAIFYPVTDLMNLGTSTENVGDGKPPKSFVQAFGEAGTNLDLWKTVGRDCSPIYFIKTDLPPTLIYHGDADTLVPLDQSERFCKAADALGCKTKLVVHPGGAHGWPSMILDLEKFADWFDEHLKPEQK